MTDRVTHAQTVTDIEAMMAELWGKPAPDSITSCEIIVAFKAPEWRGGMSGKSITRVCGNPHCLNGDHWRLVDASANRRKP